MKISTSIACLLMAATCVLAGCAPDQPASPPVAATTEDNDHNGGHVHGPMGGEVFEMEDAGIHGEWVARYGDNLVTFFIYGDDGKTEKKIKADKLVASRKIKETESFDIGAVDASDGMASKFEIVDETFAIAMKTTGATLTVEIDGTSYSTNLAKDPHAH